MRIDRTGCTRIVILTEKYAIKIPNFLNGWRLFLNGLLANFQELEYSRLGCSDLCPIIFNLPLGLILIMPRVVLLTDQELLKVNYKLVSEHPDHANTALIPYKDYFIRVEYKSNSFG